MARGPEDTHKISINQQYWQGGVSIDPKISVPNAFYTSTGLDFRSLPSQISVLPGPRQLANNLTGLITAMEQDLNGVRYGIATDGSLYRISISNVLSKIAQLTSAGTAGILYNQITDQLYIPGTQTVSMYGQVTQTASGGPQLWQDLFAQSASNAPGCTNLYNTSDGFFDGVARSTAAATYAVPTSLNEQSGNYCFFAADIEPFYSIQVWIVTKGTGYWTLTLHDSLNNKLAAVTVTNANLTSGAFNEFKFTAPGIRALVNASQTGSSATYHFHLTSTVGDGTAQVVNANDLSSANFLLYAYRLVKTNNGWHPTTLFTGSGKPLLCIGNGQYLSTYDFSNDASPTNQQWQRHYLTFRLGDEVCGLSTNNQFLVIATERRSTNANRNAQRGALYFWDGSTNAPNFVIDLPMGSPYGIYTFNNVTYFACAGSLFAWSGGQTVIKVRKLAYQNTDYLNAVDSTIINPNMLTSRYNLLMLGYPSSTTNTNINYGVWSWGSVELTFPNSYCLSYLLSNGLTSYSSANNLQIGCVQNFVDTMYTSWQYTDSGGITHYGMDILDNFSTPAANFSWRSLIFDGGLVYKTKNAVRLKLKFLPLPANCTLQAFYSLNRGADILSDMAVTGDTDVIQEIDNGRFHELQWGFVGTSNASATTAPTITGIVVELDPLTQEVDLRKDG
jgi:hypothetical protein